MKSSQKEHDKRRAVRRPIVDSFSVFAVLPSKGGHRLPVVDLSELGIGFNIDTLGEFKAAMGEKIPLHFYLNQSLFIPLEISVVRAIDNDLTQRVGAEFLSKDSSNYKALLSFLRMIDEISDIVQIAE